ncbi:MAG TPA: hypothetical protein VFP48_12470, partial [Steroidobacteraceae bacterium]|nr:hypothetical protein [Steroidobacteraceae bacterium]
MTQQRHRGLLAGFVAALTVGAGSSAAQTAQDSLPEMGTAAQETLSIDDENRIGRMVMREVRESGVLLEDPEVGEYIQSLGLKLS